ncbi:MAG: antitoxin family protein [Methanosarcinales archaeon]
MTAISKSKVIPAVYEDGVFKPLETVNLNERYRVDLVILDPRDELGDISPEAIEKQKKKLSKLIGIINSGLTDVSVNHDKYLYGVEEE